ncbi:N-acetylmuramoyl-L-alanine amidase [Micromonospora sp. NPDC047465]|uniref:peptidoglycan recognition protein family protein n=1 Tax=Micromonospora sp. NPDC047465 TaxID=3154813 RepID=UPI0033E58A74
MRLTWLPEVLRAAGLTVHGASGWNERGSSSWGPIEGITIHETRGSRTSTDAGEIRVLIHGSNSAPPPIAQLYLSRSGEWWVIASGRCNHNLVGWAGPNRGLGNSRLLGIEAQHAAGEAWTARQYDSYVRGVAALVRHLRIPVGRVAGHKEHQPWPAPAGQTSTKSDPEFDMTKFRRDVAARLTGEDDNVTPAEFLTILKDPKVSAELSRLPWAFKPADHDGETAHGIVLNNLTHSLLTANNLATNADTKATQILARLDGLDEEILAGLGGQPAPEVAQALVAAGQDPAALAAELTKLAGTTPQG